MFSTRTLLAAGVAMTLAVTIGGAAVWYLYLRGDAPPPVTLASAVEAIQTATPVTQATTLSGTWVVDSTPGSFVGYRVGEELVRVGVTTAVGRTTAVSGEVVINGDDVEAASITADLTQLESDSDMRDGQLRRQAIETDAYPTATFVLTSAVTLPADAAAGAAFATMLTGELTLHGVTRTVSIPVEAQLSDTNLIVVGSIDIVFADYNIEKPSGSSVVSIEDHGILEIQLYLAQA